MNIFDLKQLRAKAVADARAIMDKNANAVMGAEDQAQYDRAMEDFERYDKLISDENKRIEAERAQGEIDNARKDDKVNDAMKLFGKALGGDIKDVAKFMDSYTLGDNSQAGYLTAPVEFVAQLIKGLDDDLFMRKISHITPRIGMAQSLGFPYLATDASDAEWEGEVDSPTEESTIAFGRREFKPYRMAKLVKISRTLMNHADLAPEALLERMRYKIAVTQEKAYMSGNGSSKPLGIFTASDSGIPTSRDVTANKATSLKGDDLFDLKYSLKGQYHQNLSWVMHRDLVKMVAKLKDSQNQYLWQVSIQQGQPDMLLGRPVYMSEYAPNTVTAGNYVAVLGDFRNYWICDADALQVQVLKEMYATTNQTGYLFNYFGDAMPVVGEAFARLKMGASD